ncbi:MAG: dihydroorotate dehydrogenase electron transfer subunit, partial [Candidatus Bathyarchaeota archaeon]|nr:dihydroorotate dehydrogenase electron transfer subunit [Candidatus Bathyarchaeota archaeon]
MPVYLSAVNRLRIVKIQEIKTESPTVKTFTFQDKLCGKAEPGQFVMVWIPGIDEIPISLSTITPNGLASITVAQVGEATKALHQGKRGEVLGIRGPYGKGFTLTSGNIMIAGGGTGLVPLMPLTEKLVKPATKLTFLLGAKTKDELLFLDRINQT